MQKIDTDGGSLTDAPNENYRKFFEKFNSVDTLDPKEWKPVHVLGYFCKKYLETYKIKYKFKFNSPSPSKCFEVFQIKKLASNLTSDPVLLKDYIDWVYKTKVIQAKRRLTSISLMTVEGVMNEYKFKILLNDKHGKDSVDRSTPLLAQYIDIFSVCGYNIVTYGELAFLNQMSDKPDDLNKAFSDIKELGFDMSILDKVV